MRWNMSGGLPSQKKQKPTAVNQKTADDLGLYVSKGGVDTFDQNLKEFSAAGKLYVGLSYSFSIYYTLLQKTHTY